MRFFEQNQNQNQKYNKSTLIEIVFQAHIHPNESQRILNIDYSDFQKCMIDQGYTLFDIELVPLEKPSHSNLNYTFEILKTLTFSDTIDEYRVILSKAGVLFCYTYASEDIKDGLFKSRLIGLLDVYFGIYKPKFTQVNIKHINAVNSTIIDNTTDEEIISFIPNHVFSEIDNENFGDIKHLEKKISVTDDNISAEILYVIGRMSGKYGIADFKSQLTYLMNIECYSKLDIGSVQDASKIYDTLSNSYDTAFRSSISNKLFQKLVYG